MIKFVESNDVLQDVISNYNKGEYRSEIFFFYHSNWDSYSKRVLNTILKEFENSELEFFIVDMFEDPSMWREFRPNTTPSLVILTDTGPKVQTIPQMINITLEALSKKFCVEV